MRYIILTFLLGLGNILIGQSEDELAKVYIEKASIKVQFEKDNQGQVFATYDFQRNFVSETALKYKVSESIFFDDNSEVNKLKKKGRRVEPIISDYQSNGIFHSDLKLCYIEHEFNNSGEKAKITYQKKFNDIKYIDPIYFVDRYELDEITVEIRKPDWLELNIIEWNFELEEVIKTETKKGKETIFTYKMTDLNPYTKVNNLPSLSKVYAHLILNPVAVNVKGKRVTLIESTDDLYNWYSMLVSQIGNDPSELKNKVSELIDDKATDIEKIKAIYYWVQDNIRYIAFESGIMGFRPESCQSVFSNKYGDCKGMANLTKEMLKIAGFDARLTWIGTNSLPYDYSVPSLIVDNHMICTVIVDDKQIFLDATEKNADLNYYASRIQGKEVMIENGNSYIISKIPNDKNANKEVYKSNLKIEGNKLAGNVQRALIGGKKASMAYYLSSLAVKDHEEFMSRFLSNADKNITVEVATKDFLIKREQRYELNYDIQIANRILMVSNELYFNPESDFPFQEFEKIEERDIPYDMGSESVIDSETIIAVPSGYSVTYLPEAVKGSGDGFSFDLSFQEKAGSIYYQKNISVTKLTIEPSEFEKLNKVIDQLKTFYSDQIILEKS